MRVPVPTLLLFVYILAQSGLLLRRQLVPLRRRHAGGDSLRRALRGVLLLVAGDSHACRGSVDTVFVRRLDGAG